MRRLAAASLLALMTAACGGSSNNSSGTPQVQQPGPTPTPTPTPAPSFSRITEDDLAGTIVPALTDMGFLRAPDDALPAFTPFSGTLTFTQALFSTDIVQEFDGAYSSSFFPGFSIDLLSDGDDIFPVQRDIISAYGYGDSFWDVVVGAGKIWVESEDTGWHRASIPINLVSRRVGQVRNCIALFLFTTTTVSKTYVQCSQETAPIDTFHPGDMRALVELSYTPGTIANEAQEITDFRDELSERLTVRPWSDIVSSDPNLKDTFNRDADPENVQSLGALVIDGVIYRQRPLTRHGPYPYPNEMRHGVFSVTKTMGASLSLLYLAERYGDGIFDALITDYVPALAMHPGWQGVTFEHTLNMVTGTVGDDFDNNGAYINPFIDARSADAGINAIAQLADAPPAPGTAFHYASTHTFVLSYAMQKYVEAQEGAGVLYWDLVADNVLAPIGIHHFAIQKTLEPGGAEGIPTMGWGAFPTADEAAKIALLLQNEGMHNGMQLLHGDRTREATNKTAWPGYDAGGGTFYQHAFWLNSFNINLCSFKASSMQGHGANYVSLLPSEIIVLRFMDNNAYDLSPMVRAAEAVRSSCGP